MFKLSEGFKKGMKSLGKKTAYSELSERENTVNKSWNNVGKALNKYLKESEDTNDKEHQ